MLETYYTLFSLIEKNPRIQPNAIATYFGKTGRGRSPSTFMRHIQNMYRKGISREPRLTLKPFENCQNTIYFCKKTDKQDTFTTFLNLYNDKQITYVILLSGRDFLVTSREKELNLRKFGLEIEEKSKLYTPMYTIPEGWNISVSEALDGFVNSDFEKGLISREVYGRLQWSKVDWAIYDFMRENMRHKFTAAARKVGVYPKTAKHHFFENILPNCVIAHYFFPKGYSVYQRMLLKIHSEYEKGIVASLKKLPCTSYVFPLEKESILILFHDDEPKILKTFQKMREIGIINDYLFYVPIVSAY